jgi:lipopolysaccharide biosynthesis protein
LLRRLGAGAEGGVFPFSIQVARRADWTGSRVAVIAHWDPDGVVDAYVLHYAAALRAMGYFVLLSSDRPLRFARRSGLEAASGGELPMEIDAIVYRTCQGYDFTSWKAAFCAFPSLFSAAELLITNDSIFAPVGSLAYVHEAMDSVSCDFWGMVESHDKQPHLQSYYLVLRGAAVRSVAFRRFWDYVGALPNKEQAIACELSFALWLCFHGLRAGAYSPAENQPHPLLNPTHCGWEHLLEVCRAPFIKRDLIFSNPYRISLCHMDIALRNKGYPVHLILDYAARRRQRVLFPTTAGEHSLGTGTKHDDT